MFFFVVFIIALPVFLHSQKVTYSDFEQDDTRDINFEIIGKMKGNILVYKNIRRWQHKINILGPDMKIAETIKLDFVPEKTFNVDFIAYPDYFWMIYQFQKKNTLHCMAVKMDTAAKKIGEPIEIDTTQIPFLADNKIYTTIYSEDKQKIMVFKLPKKNDHYSIATMLFNSDMKLITEKSRQSLELDERRDNYDNFSLDNEGSLVFTKDSKTGFRENSNILYLCVKEPSKDTIAYHDIELNKFYIDEVHLKVDNLNKRYALNTFYYRKNRGSIEGLFTYMWDKPGSQLYASFFSPIGDSVRDMAKSSGQLRFALDDYFIKQVFVKKDGSFMLVAEDFSSQSRSYNNSWSRWDYLNSYNYSPYNYYYNPYSGFYRPFNSFGNQGSTRYFYSNILIFSFDKNGNMQWAKVINKDQADDDTDNFLSYSTMNRGGEIVFLFNDDKNKNQIIAQHSLSGNGTLTRNATLKSQERGYMFMPRLSKQVGANQLIIPCMYRSYICFAKIDF